MRKTWGLPHQHDIRIRKLISTHHTQTCLPLDHPMVLSVPYSLSLFQTLGWDQGPGPGASWNFQGNTQRVQATGITSRMPAAPYYPASVTWFHECQGQQGNLGFLLCWALNHSYICLSDSQLISMNLGPQNFPGGHTGARSTLWALVSPHPLSQIL